MRDAPKMDLQGLRLSMQTVAIIAKVLEEKGCITIRNAHIVFPGEFSFADELLKISEMMAVANGETLVQ